MDKNVNEIIYIGGIDEQGNIYRKIESCSEQIKQKINEQKNKYKKERPHDGMGALYVSEIVS